MKDTVNEWRFVDAMSMDGNGFSRYGAAMLFDYLTEFEEDMGVEFEFDPVAFRSQFSEYDIFHYIDDYMDIEESEVADNWDKMEEEEKKEAKENYAWDMIESWTEERVVKYDKEQDVIIVDTERIFTKKI
jgi:hypothetical protein